jgi:hypothetical protein
MLMVILEKLQNSITRSATANAMQKMPLKLADVGKSPPIEQTKCPTVYHQEN